MPGKLLEFIKNYGKNLENTKNSYLLQYHNININNFKVGPLFYQEGISYQNYTFK